MKGKPELERILRSDEWLMDVLQAVRSLHLPEWALAAGVIRNVVWDTLHGYARRTPLDDIDVPYFDPLDLARRREKSAEAELLRQRPEATWDVKNQAAVHLWYPDVFGSEVPAFTSLEDAISHNPETCTSVGVRLEDDGRLEVIAPCGLDDLLHMVLRRNPRRVSLEFFRQRLREKRIQERWPRVLVIDG